MPKIANKTFCIMPFVHSNIRTNGNIHLCCTSIETSQYNIKTSNIKDWWKSLDNIRSAMLSGEPVDACRMCYEQENHGLVSLRQSNNKRFKIISEKYADKIVNNYYKDLELPIDYELQITNICNLKCIMCNEFDSSAILTENRILKISNIDQSQYSWRNEEIEKVLALLQNTNTKSVTLRGGEPFLIPQIKQAMYDVISSGRSTKIDLRIDTNCTTFDSDWIDILDKFKSVWIICSIDAVDDRAEFIRYGSNWKEIYENVKLMKTIKNVTITVNSVVQNISLMGLPELIEWCKQNELYIKLTPISDPKFLSIGVLPMDIKKLALDSLKNIKYNKVENLESIIEYLSDSNEFSQKLWKEFVEFISLKDTYRKTNFKETFFEFRNYF
jgi:MoaA/NifB/PqqE/SkfB family radical SAM enzyme